MWALLFLCVLELSVCQAGATVASTQMYYVKVTIDENVLQNLTKILRTFTSHSGVDIKDMQKTTTCQPVAGGTECWCESGYEWTEKLCLSDSSCCGSRACVLAADSAHMCISEDTVVVSGSVNIKNKDYLDCLADKRLKAFQDCDARLTEMMKKVFSTFRAFDFFKLTNYSFGSVTANFVLVVAERLNQQDLIDQSNALSKSLSATFNIESTGVVSMTMPENPVSYRSKQEVRCSTREYLKVASRWELRRHDRKVLDINEGTQASIWSTALTSSLTLANVSEMWGGEYSCIYQQTLKSGTIIHRASAVLDVALLPDIYITTLPAFPRCKGEDDLLLLRGRCEIRGSDEDYIVSWTSPDIRAALDSLPTRHDSQKTTVYAVETTLDCRQTTATLTCTFQNRRNQTRAATVNINFIDMGDQYCSTEGDWYDTKAGFTAELKCRNSDGRRRRKCSHSSMWGEEDAECVNLDVATLLRDSTIVDIGIGSQDENAALVFHRFKNVTNYTQAINSFTNMKTSVDILRTLSQKSNVILSESAASDFLYSSSNLMEKSLEKSWTEKTAEDNVTLGELYLSSVERLIEMANMKSSSVNRNIQVAVCRKNKGSRCVNTAFNVTVDFDSSDDDDVTTTGFKQLDNYLPHQDEEYKINSIIVSTTTQRRHSASVTVDIKFPLLRQRPRNVDMKCVYWDNATRQWSPSGCEWKGPAEYGHCVCRHLSSFAVLMAKDPMQLPGMTQITLVGLSLSVLSLVITIIITVATWGAVVRTNTLYLRQTALINISVCLLVGNGCFLASRKPSEISLVWCKVFVVLKHFSYLSMFFWMLCLSCMLLHQAIFLFHPLSKKNYLKLCVVLGYVCPLCIVTATVLANDGGAEGQYFTSDTCWLVFRGALRGSIHTFVIPIGIILCVNTVSMFVVIITFVTQPHLSEPNHNKAKSVAKSVLRTVTLLTPIFAVTWLFGFGVLALDLSSGFIAYMCNYAFILLNTFQGVFILLTSCLGDRQVRDALLKLFKKEAPATKTECTMTVS